jgi:pimeloyl-ACP methyl ester carboxylesterase
MYPIMKLFGKILINTFRYLLVVLILLFSIAAFIGHSYLQTIFLWLLLVTIIYWPSAFKEKWNKRFSTGIRLVSIVILFCVSFLAFRPAPKTSIYLSEDLRNDLMKIYDNKVTRWPEDTEDIYVKSTFGKVHILACGDVQDPPLVLIHAASMGAHSWAENLSPLINHYRIYSVDNIGEGNKSALNDPLVYPGNQKEIADHFALIMDSLGVNKSPLFGASNGGFVAMCYTSYYPERVESLALFGPMGLTQLSSKSFMMLSIASMYPFQFVRDKVTEWALGDSPAVLNAYGDWFNCIMKGTIPSVAEPVPMTASQKARMDLPVLLFLGTEDQIVGDVDHAREMAEEYPDIRIEVLESGHIMAVEHARYINFVVADFLNLEYNP